MLKRTPDESNNKDEGSDSDLRQEHNAKRVKLTLSSDKTLHDLPVEVLERLLVKAVVMEVKDMKLAKSVWTKKADLVIGRLRTVCRQWNSILTTNLCRSDIHNILQRTAQQTYRVDILRQSPTQSGVSTATALRDEIFMLCKQPDKTYSIVVYDRHNTADAKDIIALPGMNPQDIAGCSISNCLYVLNYEADCYSVSRVSKVDEHQFNISPWICDLRQPISHMSRSSSGNLVILSRDIITDGILSGQLKFINPVLVKVYDPRGSLLHEITLNSDIISIRCVLKVIQKFNGNLLLASVNATKLMLTEIDMTGRILCQHQSAFEGTFCASMVDIDDRILICDQRSGMELLDSELNPLDFKSQKQFEGQFVNASKLRYNSERNEIVRVCDLASNNATVLTIFRFIEE